MADLSSIASVIPSKDTIMSIGGTTMHFITIAIIFIIFLFVAFIIVWFVLQSLKWNKRIVIYGKIGNNPFWQRIGRDRAREIKIGASGDTVHVWRKRRVYRMRPEIAVARNEYWYALREDGEYINIGIGDINEQMRSMGVKFTHADMRYAKAGLIKLIKERYDKPKFMEKYGTMIVNLAAIIVICVFLYLIVDKIVSVSGSVRGMVEMSGQVMEKAKDVVIALNNVCTSKGVVA